jgi:hypothetical protein
MSKCWQLQKRLLDNTGQFDEAGSNSHSVNDAKNTWGSSPLLHTANTETPLPVPTYTYSPFAELQPITENQFSHYFFTNDIFSIPNNLILSYSASCTQ